MRPGVMTVCNEPGCAELVRGRWCPRHARDVAAGYRAASMSWSWVYRDARWSPLRALVLREQPTCARVGCTEPATEVDHKVALQDGGAPFDRTNLHGLCKPHHSAKTLDEIRARR